VSRRILIVEDDDALARLLADNLRFEGFTVERARDVPETLHHLQSFTPDLVLLDLMLPVGDGLDICRELGARPTKPPIIILSARGRKEDKVRGLDLGADDYVAKPFDIDELLARIRAVLRRREPSAVKRLRLGDLVVDFAAQKATRAERPLALRHRDLQILRFLAERAGKVVSRDELLREVWGYRETPLTRAVDIAMARLRRKVEPDPREPRYLKTAHGDGYCLIPDELG
jgi:DNA-binding response OmpR family regulator